MVFNFVGRSQELKNVASGRLLQSRQVFASLREFALFHAFSDIVVDECALGVHEVKLVIDARKDFGDGRAVRDPQEAHCLQLKLITVHALPPDEG